MKALYDENFQLTDEGIAISNEWDSIVRPFFEKYKLQFDPIHFQCLADEGIQLLKCGYYLDTVESKLSEE